MPMLAHERKWATAQQQQQQQQQQMGASISRQASVGHLAANKKPEKPQKVGAQNRSKRCKSLLMLSSPFSSSSSGSVKSSLLSLLHPNQSPSGQELQQQKQQQQQQPFLCDEQESFGSSMNSAASFSTATTTSSCKHRAKCVKMKLFEQPLEKLFSPKAMKQLNQAINKANPTYTDKRKRSSSSGAACLRRFSYSTSNIDANNNNNSLTTTAQTLTAGQRQQLLLAVIPEPIRNLLNELYLRGPSTVGIFRKSPNAKHCKELRQKLETDSQSSIEQFQVTVIASVFKEWLRSLPDCLLMSRLYPQWIDVAKLIEPLNQHQQQQQNQQLHRHQSQSTLDDGSYSSDNTIMSSGNTTTSLRPSRSPLTDNSGQLILDRAHSCSTMLMMSDFSINEKESNKKTITTKVTSASNGSPSPSSNSMSAFALAERHSECLRIVRQLLDALNESNLILLSSFISILWHIANNSEENKMSANNLGVCVGQSLLNDEHQSASSSLSSYSSGSSTFRKRHRRTRSQCLLSSTLSLANSLQNGCYLDSNSAQETAKYVPMLVAFMIENAPALFGQEITTMFSAVNDHQTHRNSAAGEGERLNSSSSSSSSPVSLKVVPMDLDAKDCEEKENRLLAEGDSNSFDQVDSGCATTPETQEHTISLQQSERVVSISPAMHQRIVVVGNHSTNGESHFRSSTGGSVEKELESGCCSSTTAHRIVDDNGSTTTSILIVNPPKPNRHNQQPSSSLSSPVGAGAQHRPLSATESTSSSQSASSSTSGVHSESPAFSSELDSQTNTRTTTSTSSPTPSSVVSSPTSSSVGSSPNSPVQEVTRQRQETSAHLVGGSSSPSQQQQQTDASGRRRQSANIRPLSEASITRPKNIVNLEATEQGRAAHQYHDHRHTLSSSVNNYNYNRYGPFMGVLNRVPKIPVQFTTSSYGGEAVIYNPKPRRPNSMDPRSFGAYQCSMNELDSLPNNSSSSVISVKPLQEAPAASSQQTQQQYHTLPTSPARASNSNGSSNQQELLREQRLNEFLAHQHQHHPLISAPSLPYLPQSSSSSNFMPPVLSYQRAAAANSYLQQQRQQQQQQQLMQQPIFYSAANLSLLQQQQQDNSHHDRYLLYQRASLNPQRSHVMSLRDYYLSLQQNQQRQQQQMNSYRDKANQQQSHSHHQLNQRAMAARGETVVVDAKTSDKQLIHQSSQQPQSLIAAQQRQYLTGNQQLRHGNLLAAASTHQAHEAAPSGCLTSHHTMQRPRPRLAKIRQNHFNGIYVKDANSISQTTAATLALNRCPKGGATLAIKPSSASSSADHSSDESDESMNDWMESTMV